jgi:hypothetical protein
MQFDESLLRSRHYYLSILQPTIRSVMSDEILQPTICCDLHSVPGNTSLDYPMRSTLSVDSTTDYPIYRISVLICMAILQTIIFCAVLCLAILQQTLCAALLCLAIIQLAIPFALPIDITTDYPLCSVSRYYNRLSALLCSTLLYSVC